MPLFHHQPHTSFRRWIGPLVIILLIITVGMGGYWWVRINTYNLETVEPGVLYRDGVASMRQFKTAVRDVKPQTIVRLLDNRETAREPFVSELAYCRANGIKVMQINIRPGDEPTSADIQRFLDIVAQKQNQPVLVHCHQGVRRTGMMVAAYQQAALHYTNQQAIDAIRLFGRAPDGDTFKTLRRFIQTDEAAQLAHHPSYVSSAP